MNLILFIQIVSVVGCVITLLGMYMISRATGHDVGTGDCIFGIIVIATFAIIAAALICAMGADTDMETIFTGLNYTASLPDFITQISTECANRTGGFFTTPQTECEARIFDLSSQKYMMYHMDGI